MSGIWVKLAKEVGPILAELAKRWAHKRYMNHLKRKQAHKEKDWKKAYAKETKAQYALSIANKQLANRRLRNFKRGRKFNPVG